MEEKKVSMDIKDGKFEVNVDTDKDGVPALKAVVNFGEAFQEAFKKGEAVEGARVVSVEFTGLGLKVKLDTDRDSESSLELEINLAEAVDETGLLKLGS